MAQALGGCCGGRFIALLAKRSRFHPTLTLKGPSVNGGAELVASHCLQVGCGIAGHEGCTRENPIRSALPAIISVSARLVLR